MFKQCSLLLSILILCGCNPFDSSDYKGYIEEVKETSLVISPHATDPEADYPVYEVFLTDETSIEGNKQSLGELEHLDNVQVWLNEINEDGEFAGRIVVED